MSVPSSRDPLETRTSSESPLANFTSPVTGDVHPTEIDVTPSITTGNKQLAANAATSLPNSLLTERPQNSDSASSELATSVPTCRPKFEVSNISTYLPVCTPVMITPEPSDTLIVPSSDTPDRYTIPEGFTGYSAASTNSPVGIPPSFKSDGVQPAANGYDRSSFSFSNSWNIPSITTPQWNHITMLPSSSGRIPLIDLIGVAPQDP